MTTLATRFPVMENPMVIGEYYDDTEDDLEALRRENAWKDRTEAQILSYVKANCLGIKIMEHLMVWRGGDAVNLWIWEALLPGMVDMMPDVLAAGADEYITEHDLKSDFVDFVMEVMQ